MTQTALESTRARDDTSLHALLTRALACGAASDFASLRSRDPVDERDAFLTLLAIYDLWTAPLQELAGAEIHQSNPDVVAVKASLDRWFVERLDGRIPRPEVRPEEAVDAMRRIATRNLVPPVYEWLVERATWPQLVQYLALEGGPDADFDDLVAIVQIGISGDPRWRWGPTTGTRWAAGTWSTCTPSCIVDSSRRSTCRASPGPSFRSRLSSDRR
jgi:hypothetical protein